MDLSPFQQLLATLATLAAGVAGIFRYFKYRTRRDELRLVRESFDSVVAALASEVEVERMAAAILLRRFLDATTEAGIGGKAVYAKEAVNVIAAVLRGEGTGTVQKLLADGLAFAPTLKRADLQRTNLQLAYLRSRKRRWGREVPINLAGADFYRADLSRASLKGARAPKAVFYQARLSETVLEKADLQGANFYEADLGGAQLGLARLDGADFTGARNLPDGLEGHLDENRVYRGETPFSAPARPSRELETRVFLSRPGVLDPRHEELVASLRSRLEAQGMTCEILSRSEYPRAGALAEVQRRMAGCSGAVILGFEQLVIRHGSWRPGTSEEQRVRGASLPTPWNQVEAGMAAMLGLPMLVLREGAVGGGVFDVGVSEPQVYHAALGDWSSGGFRRSFEQWCAHVRERARRGPTPGPAPTPAAPTAEAG